MTTYRAARLLILRAIKDEAKTSDDLAEALGMARRYVNRVLAYMAGADVREVYIEDWHAFERKKSGTFYSALWSPGSKRNKARPSKQKAERNARYRERLRQRKKNAALNAAARTVAIVKRDEGIYRNARVLVRRLLVDEARAAGDIAHALGYTTQHTLRVLRYMNAAGEAYIEDWRHIGDLSNTVAVWRAGRGENKLK